MEPKIAILASGEGTLLEAFLEAEMPIDLIVSDRHCRAFDEVAQNSGIAYLLKERKCFTPEFEKHRGQYTLDLAETLKGLEISLIVMAGFKTKFSKDMFTLDFYQGRITNSHPALSPAFPGNNAVQDALDYGVKVTGTTIHIAIEEVDRGPIVAQEPVRVHVDDTVETLHERIKKVERVLYPEAIKEMLFGKA